MNHRRSHAVRSDEAVQIVWFKRDLRVEDHEPLYRAALSGRVIPLYIVEPGLWRQPDTSGRHWAFVRECLISLREGLSRLGQPLAVRHGEAVEVLRALCTQHKVTGVWSHQETGNAWTYRRDRAVAEMLRQGGIPWHQPRQHGVVRGPVDRDGWSRQWEALMRVPQFEPPALAPVGELYPGTVPDRPTETLADDLCPGLLYTYPSPRD